MGGRETGATHDALPAHPVRVAPAASRGLLGSHSPGLVPWPSSVGLSGHSSGELGITPAPSSDSLSSPSSCSSLGLPDSWNEHDLRELSHTRTCPRLCEDFGKIWKPEATVLHPPSLAFDISGKKTRLSQGNKAGEACFLGCRGL